MPFHGAAVPERRSHAPVDIRRLVLDRGELGDPCVVGRQVTDRIGRRRIAGEREGLAAAAAEIYFAS